MKKFVLFLFVLIASLTACKKDSFITGSQASVGLSVDTIHFDTVFTSTGSVTHLVKIYNTNDQKLLISAIQLAGGNNSSFRINADGTPGPVIQNIEIASNDSIYIFATVKIDPSTNNLPFIIQDSISIDFNGNRKWIQLEAWGQNAHFFRARTLTTNEVWTNDLPYVITGGLLVNPNITLTIEAGCRIHVHADAPIFIDGTLVVNGNTPDSTRVLFTGDRLDDPYRDFPASWPGIIFRPSSKDNRITNAVIRNAYQAIVCQDPSVNTNPRLTLNSTIIDNSYDAGLLGIRTSISAFNCLFSNNGKNTQLIQGGKYDFTHCTSASYSNSYLLHQDPVLYITDFIKNGNTVLSADLDAKFTNCIFWGDNGTVENEIITGKLGTGIFSITFVNSLWKAKDDISNSTKVNCLVNQDPLFDTIDIQKRIFDFHLKSGSPAINKGVVTVLATDLDGKNRSIGLPDLGCYEKN
ncbi:MAG TPA: choice-of-anchor Q domain-containing protein [Flavitalea sp.]|nr:choice-of-anchor Q domain-containing protein [Flavitalea sp.]